MASGRLAIVLACGLLVAGCDATVPDSGPGDRPQSRGFLASVLPPAAPGDTGPREETRTRPQMPLPYARVTLAGGDVVVSGPDGYCIDPTTVDRGVMRAFAVIASCHILSNGRAGFVVEPLLMTVTVGPRGEVEDLPDATELAELAGAPLISGETALGFTTANLARGGADILQAGDDRYWRATFLQGGRLIGLALYAPKDSPMAGAAGQVMLRAVRERIAAGSSGRAVASATATPAGTERPGGGSLLGRLFDRQDL